MKRIRVGAVGLIFAMLVSTAGAQTPASFRVLFGVRDTTFTRWDGTLAVKHVGRYTVEGWRFEGSDRVDGNTFYLTTHLPRIFADLTNGTIVANGFTINAEAVTASSEFFFTTAQGDFSFRADQVPYGEGIYKLSGRVYIDRVPAAERLTETKQEEDYPSAAVGANGEVWLAYIQFRHNPNYNKLRVNLSEIPASFAQYQEPTGGDQVWVRRYSGGNWGEPVAVTGGGGDIYRTAVAVDGRGRAWVFWSENYEGDFDIFARVLDGSVPKEQIQISKAAGSDIDPVAAVDAEGRVWVAWQGWRNGVAAIYTARQQERGFSHPEKISGSDKNEWNPAIATDKSGRVAVAWDSYRNGNYDVFERTWFSNSWRAEIPVAASARYEAYPSIAFDPTGRLWIAYEEGGNSWGKDWGALSTQGIALYQGRLIKMRGLEPDGRLVALDASLDAVLIGAGNLRVDHLGSQSESASLDPDPGLALRRKPDSDLLPPEYAITGTAKNTLPRLVVDGSGRFWLAFRSSHPIWWSPLGGSWFEYLVSFDGKGWTKPIFLSHTDNLLDNRPALVTPTNGKLLIVNSSDGRQNLQLAAGVVDAYGSMRGDASFDPYNDDLWSREVDLGPANQVIPVVAAGAGVRPEPPTIDSANASGIQTLHGYRGGPDGNLRIVRGEFHRHSEISFDGDIDGTLLDQWRYALDAAALDWIGCCDHDNGNGREYTWWIIQKLTDVFYSPGVFVPMFSFERSVGYPQGHRNVVFVQRGIRPLPRLQRPPEAEPLPSSSSNQNDPPHSPDTQMLYRYVKEFNGIVASHSSATGMGTDWRDNDSNAEPVVEIYQGERQSYEMPGAPRASSLHDTIGGWRPKGFVSEALKKGYRLGFESSSDHISTHMSYTNLYTKELTRESVLDALRKRHVYAATDDILADVKSGQYIMGDEFSTSELPILKIKLRGTSKFAKVVIIRDGQYVYSTSPNTQEVDFSWRDYQPSKGKTSYYYVRGEQDNGEIVWVSPLWIAYTGN